MIRNSRQSLSSVFFASLLALVAGFSLVSMSGCKKKVAALPPPPPTAMAPLPTAQISATPTAINAGDSAILNWHTTDATDVSIEGVGPVPSSGTRTVNPASSTNYHLIARGDGGSADASTRVTVSSAPPPAPMADNSDSMDDSTFHQYVQDVMFDYDSYEVGADSQSVIAKDASYLAAHPRVKVLIGGYCDERGSTDYNIALGQNRANSVKVALTSAGVSPDRLRTVSYGKEKQFCSEHDEACWQKNRRGQLSPDK